MEEEKVDVDNDNRWIYFRYIGGEGSMTTDDSVALLRKAVFERELATLIAIREASHSTPWQTIEVITYLNTELEKMSTPT